MAQIPATNITMTAIATETSVSTSSITMSNLSAQSIAYTSGDGASPDVKSIPHRMNEWARYVHTQEFGATSIFANEGSTTGDYVTDILVSRVGNEPLTRGAIIFYFKLNGTTVEFYVVPDHTQTGIGAIGAETAAFYATVGGSPGSSSSFTGDFTNGFTAKKIASISGDPGGTGSVASGLTASITKTHLSGVGTQDNSISGYNILSSGATAAPHATTLNALAPMADAESVCYNTLIRDSRDKIEFKVQATGYNEKTVGTFVSKCYVVASSNNCL